MPAVRLEAPAFHRYHRYYMMHYAYPLYGVHAYRCGTMDSIKGAVTMRHHRSDVGATVRPCKEIDVEVPPIEATDEAPTQQLPSPSHRMAQGTRWSTLPLRCIGVLTDGCRISVMGVGVVSFLCATGVVYFLCVLPQKLISKPTTSSRQAASPCMSTTTCAEEKDEGSCSCSGVLCLWYSQQRNHCTAAWWDYQWNTMELTKG